MKLSIGYTVLTSLVLLPALTACGKFEAKPIAARAISSASRIAPLPSPPATGGGSSQPAQPNTPNNPPNNPPNQTSPPAGTSTIVGYGGKGPVDIPLGNGTTYYVSASGNDSNSGTSTSQAWQTIGKVNGFNFKAGDTVLFEGGQTFTGCMHFSTSNISNSSASNVFTVASYGTGRFTMQADCGRNTNGFEIESVSGFVLKNAILRGNNGQARWGVRIHNTSPNTMSNITVQSIDIGGFYDGFDQDWGADIMINGDSSGEMNTIKVLYSEIHGLNGPTSPDDAGIGGWGNIKNVLYEGNVAYNIGGKRDGYNGSEGNGMTMNGVDGGVMQYNLAHDNGANVNNCGGPGGIWAYKSANLVIQYNEVYNQRPINYSGGCDWVGFDLDGGLSNSTVQYNYAHDNFGAGFLAYVATSDGVPWFGNTFRYNLSVNNSNDPSYVDAEMRIAGGGDDGSHDVHIYGNTFINTLSNGISFQVAHPGSMSIVGDVANNIFYNSKGIRFIDIVNWSNANVSGLKFSSNDYFSSQGGPTIIWNKQEYADANAWSSATGQEKSGGSFIGKRVDPMFVNPAPVGIVNGYNPTALAGFKLQNNSPLRGAGIDLSSVGIMNIGSQNFFGGATSKNIGAD